MVTSARIVGPPPNLHIARSTHVCISRPAIVKVGWWSEIAAHNPSRSSLMVRGDDACALTGIPTQHAAVFQQVADQKSVMISSRAVGKWATGLILESYATKGFHNKAKSCNWGPMAGFVLADPRFTKAPEISKQAEALADAQHYGAKEVPVYISEERRRWLLTNNCMRPSAQTAKTHYYLCPSPQGEMMLFVLQRASNVQGANGAEMWSVNYAYSEGRVGYG